MAKTVAEKIAQWLHEKAISTAFGIVGGGNVALWDAITRAQKTRIVCCHHEQAAAMASTYFNRVRGGLGSVVLCTTGAGSTNALTGVMAAYMDRIPLLVISGNEASKYMFADTRVWGVQGYDSSGMVATRCSKWSKRPLTPGQFPDVLERALMATMQSPQGPVWLDLPKDVQNALVE